MSSSVTENLAQTGRTNFASRLLSKELNNRKKTSEQFSKLTPADAAKYAVQSDEKECLTAGKP